MIVTAPASSANLGPGFDALALAVDLPFRFAVTDAAPDGFHRAEPTHPAAVAFAAAGGDPGAPQWWHSPIPPGRGLGFSGAARVAGALAARLLAGGAAGGDGDGGAGDDAAARDDALAVAVELEGHAENAAASAHGGFVVAAGARVVALAVPDDLRLVVWSPEAATSTDASRRTLPAQVPLADAAANVGAAALWVAAVAAGRWDLLRAATADRLHQSQRLAGRPDAAAALTRLWDQPAVLGAWLSGSGPSVAALVRADDADAVASALATTGGAAPAAAPAGAARVRVLAVDALGARTA